MNQIVKIALATLMPGIVLWQSASASARVPGHTDPVNGADAPAGSVVAMEENLRRVRAAYDNLDSAQIPPHTNVYTIRRPWSPSDETEDEASIPSPVSTDSIGAAADSIAVATDSVAADSIGARISKITPPR